jgi:hypothetical protein
VGGNLRTIPLNGHKRVDNDLMNEMLGYLATLLIKGIAVSTAKGLGEGARGCRVLGIGKTKAVSWRWGEEDVE